MSEGFINSPLLMVVDSVLTISITTLGFYALLVMGDKYGDDHFNSWWTRCGFAIMYIGMLPLVFYLVAAEIGLLADPDSNLVGPGVLMMFSSMLGILVIKCGSFWRCCRSRNN